MAETEPPSSPGMTAFAVGALNALDPDGSRACVERGMAFIGQADEAGQDCDQFALFMGGTGARRPDVGLALVSAFTAALPALTAALALELAPIRVNLIAAGFRRHPIRIPFLAIN